MFLLNIMLIGKYLIDKWHYHRLIIHQSVKWSPMFEILDLIKSFPPIHGVLVWIVYDILIFLGAKC